MSSGVQMRDVTKMHAEWIVYDVFPELDENHINTALDRIHVQAYGRLLGHLDKEPTYNCLCFQLIWH